MSDETKFQLPPLPKPDPSLYRGPLYAGYEVQDYARLSNSVLIGQNETLRAQLARQRAWIDGVMAQGACYARQDGLEWMSANDFRTTEVGAQMDVLQSQLTEARRLLASSEAALQEAQRALFRWLPNRIGSEYDDLIAADAMSLMGLESTEGLREIGGEILIELMEKRRLLDEARAQVPVAYMHNKRADVIHTSVKSLLSYFAVNYGPESMLRPIDKSEHYTIPLYAAPVPAQPAVPEAVALLSELFAQVQGECPALLDGDRGGDGSLCLRIAAILSAADTEVKNGN